MNMINEKYFLPRKQGLILALIAVIFVLVTVTWSYIEKQRHLAARHHLLCEVLQPGMSKDMVLDILKQVGDIRDLGYEYLGPTYEMEIYFADEKTRETYGVFQVGFTDYKYDSAYVRGFDTYDVICEFATSTATSDP